MKIYTNEINKETTVNIIYKPNRDFHEKKYLFNVTVGGEEIINYLIVNSIDANTIKSKYCCYKNLICQAEYFIEKASEEIEIDIKAEEKLLEDFELLHKKYKKRFELKKVRCLEKGIYYI